MKRPLLLAFMIVIASTFLSAQVPGEKLVPAKIKTQFSADFPGITPKRWEKKGADWVAVMTHNNKPARARYTKEGRQRWVTHHWRGPEVPSNITAKILADYPDFKVDWATETENPNTKKHTFWVHLSKPGFVLKVLVNADGSYTKETDESIELDKPEEN